MNKLIERIGDWVNGRSPNEKRLSVKGEKLSYLEINVPEEKNVPILIGIHGLGADESQMQTLVNVELPGPYIYLSLQGFYKHPSGGYAWFPIDVVDGDFQFEREVVDRTLAQIDAFIKTAVSHYHADPTNAFFVGYSQGGALALSYLLHYPDTVKGVVSTAGNLLDTDMSAVTTEKMQNKPLFIGYGTLDPFINQERMEEIKTFFQELQVDVTLKRYKIPHVVSPAEVKDINDWLAKSASSYQN